MDIKAVKKPVSKRNEMESNQLVMDYEHEEEDRPGFFSRLAARLRGREFEEYEEDEESTTTSYRPRLAPMRDPRARVTIRRSVNSFDEAYAAASDFREGEIQIINLTGTDARLRQKIVDFLSGVNFSLDGSWEELGEDIYILAPSHTMVEASPSSARGYATRN
ncbi:MAG: cell division protein SepF [Fimbriimonadaceae bacterium]